MKTILGIALKGILWLVKPRIVKVDRETAEYLMTYGGGKPI